jgi:perosamine synthetase
MNLIELAPPRVSGREVSFAWTVTPESALYERSGFDLRFPDSVDLAAVPEAIWWRVALLILHAHWPLLRPCRVVLPVELTPGEIELWLRLTDASVATLEAHVGSTDCDRSIALSCSGPPVTLTTTANEAGGIVNCFSGGRDSTAQAAMLTELGATPTLLTVTSPVSWSNEHDTPRRRVVLGEMARRRGLEVVEVASDVRSAWWNGFSGERYAISVNELTDTFVYLAVAIAVAAARGASLVTMASEAEVQENVKRCGMVIQSRHFMYSATTHAVVSALLAPAGIRIASLTNALQQFQVQRLLSQRYADLRDLQYSCWELGQHEAACSRCTECRGIALNLLADGVSPSAAGIDTATMLLANSDWQPGGRYVAHPPSETPLPRELAGRAHEMQELRCLAAVTPERVGALMNGAATAAERARALRSLHTLRERALRYEIEPEPGYRAGYLELLPASVRDGVRSILDEQFVEAPPDSYGAMLRNTQLLARWIAAPLAQLNRRSGPEGGFRPPVTRPPQSAMLTASELERIRELIPGEEPVVERPPGGRLVPVAQTLLDGNELRYVSECVEGNWISSAGGFVRPFEQAFARAVGCRFAVACSSGTTALHLALAAAGIGPGDEVIVPAFTMIATANAVRYVGADPVLVDADPTSWNLDPDRIADKLSSRTRAVIVVHTYGQPADLDAITDVAKRNGLLVIEDAAEAHGATYHGRPVGSIGRVAAFSLYGNKILTTGEGGIVTTNDEQVATVARELRDHAFSRERHFWHRRLGFNFRMTNMQAAVGLAQTERIEQLVGRRKDNDRRYRAALAGIDGLHLPPQVDGGVTWMFGITIDDAFGCSRDELRSRLATRGVETRTFFVPMHLQPIYHHRFAGQRYPVAEALGRDGLYLPSGGGLSDDDIAYVADAVRASRVRLEWAAPSPA